MDLNKKKKQKTKRGGLISSVKTKRFYTINSIENKSPVKTERDPKNDSRTMITFVSMIKPLKRPLLFLDFYVQTKKETKHGNLIALHNSDNHGSIKFIKRAKTQMIKTMNIN